MGIEMMFEIDAQLTWERTLEILLANGFEEYEQRANGFCAFHSGSGLNAYVVVGEEPSTVLAEGLVPPRWKRNSRLTFRYSKVDFEASALETMKFARTLANETSAYFVLSFQYENVFAVRDEKGYREISDTSATMKTPV